MAAAQMSTEEMATEDEAAGPLSRLKGSDSIDRDYLLQQVAKHIYIDHLVSVAVDTGMASTDICMLKAASPKTEQRFWVLEKWLNRLSRSFTISQFMKKVEHWWQNGYVKRAVWDHLEKEGLNPAILPPSARRGVKRKRTEETPSDDPQEYSATDSPSSVSGEDYKIPSENDAEDLQGHVRVSLSRQCQQMLAKDWLEPDDADSLSLMENYVDLKWAKLEKNVEKDLPSLYSILDVVDLNTPPTAINLLIEAEPGMGKTWSTAYLALGWADKKCPEKSPLGRMDYVFLIRLREVENSSTLAETIINQHDKIKPEHKKYLTAILKGKTKHRVLILMDGYDEYRPGTNSDIDDAINYSVGNCVLILTSRLKYLKKDIRSKFLREVKIKGLSKTKITEFCKSMLNTKGFKITNFMKQAKATNISELLHVPIILYITCLIYRENKTLPESQAKMFETVFELIIKRSTLKHEDCKSLEIPHLLFELGKISWNSLQNDVKQLLLNKDDIQRASPDILKLGLLSGSRNDVDGIRADPKYFTFLHKLLHEYAAAIYVTKRLESRDTQVASSEFFPSWDDIKKQEEVIMFTHGLMANPAPLVHHVGQVFVQQCKLAMERGPRPTFPSAERLFEAFTEKKPHQDGSKYHNRYLNYYDHDPSQTKKLADIDLSPIHNPSHLYWLENLLKPPSISVVQQTGIVTRSGNNTPNMGDVSPDGSDVIPTCALLVHYPHMSIAGDVLRVCQKLSAKQPITELCLSFINDMNNSGVKRSGEVIFNLSQEARLLYIDQCVLDPQVSRHLFRQIVRCVRLQKLTCIHSRLSLEVDDLDLSRSSCLTSLTFSSIDLSPEMCEKICRDLKYLVVLETLHFSHIPIATSCCYLIEAVLSMQPKPPLKELFLSGVSIPSSMLTQLITALHNCPKMVQLNILDNEDKQGVKIEHIEDSIEALPSMKDYSLKNCNLPSWFCRQVLKSLSRSKNLRELNLSGNILTETVQNFLSRDDESLPELETLELSSAGLARNDLEHLKNVISQGKLPSLKLLNLSCNNLEGTEDLVKDLVHRWICHKNQQLKKIELLLKNTSLPEDLSDLDWLKKIQRKKLSLTI